MEIVNEKTAVSIEVTVYGYDDELASPDAAQYQIHDVDSGTVIKSATSIAPASTMFVPVNAEYNRILDSSKPSERRRVTITCNSGTDGELNDEVVYTIKNMRIPA